MTAGFLAYVTLYRLAIIGAGMVAIILGYRLFLSGVFDRAGGGTEAVAETSGFKISLKNAAPGTCFAVFGAALIIAMIVSGNPQLDMTKNGASTNGALPLETMVRLKGVPDGGQAFEAAMGRAKTLSIGGRKTEALQVYRQALSVTNLSARQIAWAAADIAQLYLAQERRKEALALARLAVQLDGTRPQNVETLAAAAKANGNGDEASRAAERAESLRHDGQ